MGTATAWDERLAASRRLDWCFLLPDPDPGSVRYLGSPNEPLAEALRIVGAHVVSGVPGGTEATRPVEGTSPSAYDLIVLPARGAAHLAAAAALVRPGGCLYVECQGLLGRRSGRPGPTAPGVADALRRMGFVAVSLHWHWPDMERTTRIMPLGGGRPRLALEPGTTELRGRVARRAIGALAALGILGWAAPAVSVLARRPGGPDPEPRGLLETSITEPGRWGLGDSSLAVEGADADWVLLTPRFHASRHVILLTAPRGSVDPAFVVKVARLPGDGAALERAAGALRALAAEAGPAADAAPRVLASGVFAGRPLLVETAVQGRPLDPGVIRRHPAHHSRAVLDWLLQLPAAAPLEARPGVVGDAGPPDWVTELVEPGLRALRALEAPAGGPLTALADAVHGALVPTARAELVRVFEHGDLAHPNLLLDRHGRLGVIDWELGRPDGLPLHDLVFFLTYAAGAVRRARTAADHAAAFEAAFLQTDGWARPLVRQYVRGRGLPAELIAPLVVAAWARYLGGLPGRTQDGPLDGDGRPPGRPQAIATWMAEHRYAAVLREALAGYGRLASIGQGA